MKKRMDSRPRGFTLIELMVAVAITAILAALAYPSYRNYVLRGRIVDATNALATLRANLERFYQDNRTYSGTYCVATTTTAAGSFNVVCTPDTTGQNYSAVATGTGPTAGFVYSIDQDNNQHTTITGVKGWNTPTAGCSIWITKAGQTC